MVFSSKEYFVLFCDCFGKGNFGYIKNVILKKRIVISVTNDLVTDQRVHKVASLLNSEGYEVVLYGRLLKNSKTLNRNYRTKRIRHFFDGGVFFYAEYNFRLFIYLLLNKFDVLISNDLDTLLANFLVSKIKNTKIIYDSHELFTEVPELNNKAFQKAIWNSIEKNILPKLKNTITVCDSIARYYNNKYSTNFITVRNVPFKQSVSKGIKKERVLIYQGALNLDRGIELMIKSVAILEDTSLWIVGKGDIESELKQLVFDLNLSDKVIFLGQIKIDKLSSITQKAIIGLSLERNTSKSYYYALPNKLFDYIQANIPVIVSDLPEMKAIVEKYEVGCVLKDHKPESLSKLISEIIDNNQLYNKFVYNSTIAANDLNWENEQENYLRVINNIK